MVNRLVLHQYDYVHHYHCLCSRKHAKRPVGHGALEQPLRLLRSPASESQAKYIQSNPKLQSPTPSGYLPRRVASRPSGSSVLADDIDESSGVRCGEWRVDEVIVLWSAEEEDVLRRGLASS